MKQVLNLTDTSDASQGTFAPPPVVPPSLAMCAPAKKELPTLAPTDTVSHTPAPVEVVLSPTPASMDRVASDAIGPNYIKGVSEFKYWISGWLVSQANGS